MCSLHSAVFAFVEVEFDLNSNQVTIAPCARQPAGERIIAYGTCCRLSYSTSRLLPTMQRNPEHHDCPQITVRAKRKMALTNGYKNTRAWHLLAGVDGSSS